MTIIINNKSFYYILPLKIKITKFLFPGAFQTITSSRIAFPSSLANIVLLYKKVPLKILPSPTGRGAGGEGITQ